MNKKSKIGLILLLALVCNLVVIATTLHNAKVLYNSHEYLTETNNRNLLLLSDLHTLEREIGYVGFIHHFKNYIIRAEQKYYSAALVNYHAAVEQITLIQQADFDPQINSELAIIQKTLDLYLTNLTRAKQNISVLSTRELDNLVRVDDSQASNAIRNIVDKILPRVNETNRQYLAKIDRQMQTTYLLSVFVCLAIVGFSYFVIRQINQLSDAARKFSQLLNASPDAIIHANSKGKILTVNPAAEKLFDYSNSEFLQKSIEDLVPKDHIEKHKKLRQAFVSEVQSREMNDGLKIYGVDKNHNNIPLQIAIGSFKSDLETHSISVIRDMRLIEGLNQELSFLSDVINGLSAYVAVVDTNYNIVAVGDNVLEAIQQPIEQLKGKEICTISVWACEVSAEAKLKEALTIVQNQTEPVRFDSYLYTQPNTRFAVEMTLTRIQVNQQQAYIICSATDITERKAYEKQILASEAKFKKVVTQTADMLVIFNKLGTIQWTNARASKIFLSSLDIADPQSNFLNCFSEDDRKLLDTTMHSLHELGDISVPLCLQLQNHQANLSVEITLSIYSEDNIVSYLATISDVSELVKANHKLATLVAEKSSLLNEIHHRVKNNLQVINSLLTLQQQHVSAETASELVIYQQRIRSIALVHQLLYEHEDYSSINIVEYINKLAHLILLDGINQPNYKVQFELPDHEIFVQIKQTVPIGFVVNEILTNIQKHAFTDKDPENLVSIQVMLDTDGLHITIRDNGVGMSVEAFDTSESLGHRLIDLFTKQARGQLQLEINHGSCFKFSLSLDSLLVD